MKLSYDKDADAFTIVFSKEKVVRDDQISEDVFAGFSKSGSLVEIQVLDVSYNSDVWLTVELVAKILNKSERTILRWIEKGTLPAKKMGKEYRINPEDVQELAA
jgi:excisionase family DNA binding protein